MTTAVTENGSDVLRPREYQLEMLRDSMQKNIIVAVRAYCRDIDEID